MFETMERRERGELLLDALATKQREIAAAHVESAELAAQIGDLLPGEDDWAREEIAAALTISMYAADQLLTVGRAFRNRLAGTGRALAAGALSWAHVRHLVHHTRQLDDATVAALEPDMLAQAEDLRPAAFEKVVKRAVAAADTAASAERHDRARSERSLRLYPDDDGMATLVAHGPATDLLGLYNILDATAGRLGPDDSRPIDARRFDRLVDAGNLLYLDPAAPRPHGRPAGINITMTLGTALGLRDLPAELEHYGPIPARVARELARDGRWRALIVDATTGALEGLGTRSYQPTQRIVDFIDLRHPTCSHPQCGIPAQRCDIEHAIPWPDGATDVTNLGNSSRRHHRAKHQAGWTVTQDRDGTRNWTSPLGQSYTVRPHAYMRD